MSAYFDEIKKVETTINGKEEWKAINPEYSVRMKLQNRFKTGLEIAQYTADIMRKDMADYDADPSQYTQSLGCWHGFIAQQVMMGVKRHRKTTDKSYIYLSGWMVAALRSQFGPLPYFGGSRIMPSYLFSRRISRFTNLMASSVMNLIGKC